MLDRLKRWWHRYRHPDQRCYMTGTNPVAQVEAPGEPPLDPKRPLRLKVVLSGGADGHLRPGHHTQVIDVETGQHIPWVEIDWHAGLRGAPELVIKTYNCDFSYEGPAKVLVCCPKCKAEMQQVRLREDWDRLRRGDRESDKIEVGDAELKQHRRFGPAE